MRNPRGGGGIAVGMARASIYGTYRTDKRLVDEVDVRVLVARGDGGPVVLAVADVCNLWESTCLRLRGKVAEALDVPAEHVFISATQNHAVEFVSGDDRKFDHDKLDRAFVECARKAAARVRPVEVARVATPVPGMVICGRLAVAGFDPFFVYYGYRVEGGRADGSHVVKQALTSLSKGEPFPVRVHQVTTGGPEDFDVPPAPVPVPTPLYAPPAADDLVQTLFFRTPDGEPVGSVIRFAVHPIAANRQKMDWQSGELCAYARRRLEAEFGGLSLYLTGPSQDQYPLVGRKSIQFGVAQGNRLAAAALAGLDGAQWDGRGPVAAASREIRLPWRSGLPQSVEAARKEKDALEARFKELAAKGAPLPELKKLADHYSNLCLFTEGQLYEWSEARDRRQPGERDTQHLLFAMRLGRSVIAPWAGESDGAWSVRLRKQTLGDDLILMERTSWPTHGEIAGDSPGKPGDPSAPSVEPDPDRILADATREMIAGLMRLGEH